MASRKIGPWNELLQILDPRKFTNLLEANVEAANRRSGVELRDRVRRGIKDQTGLKKLHPFTVHRRNTRKDDAAARGGSRDARRSQRGKFVTRGRHKRLLDSGAAGLWGAITFHVDGLRFVVGVKYMRPGKKGPVDIAKIQEFGMKIKVTPKMRGYLHAKGLHLKPSTTHIEIPASHFMKRGLKGGEKRVIDLWDGAVEATVQGRRFKPRKR